MTLGLDDMLPLPKTLVALRAELVAEIARVRAVMRRFEGMLTAKQAKKYIGLDVGRAQGLIDRESEDRAAIEASLKELGVWK